MQSSYFANSSVLDPISDDHATSSDTWLFAGAWGWNSNHRAGHLTADQVDEPRQVQRSKTRNYIACAAGTHHSLLVSDRGIVYSFGDGRKGQLGYGNLFTGDALKGGVVQATPSSVTPTGNLKFGRDIQCIEVAAGGAFSVAREASPEEGAKRVVGFLPMERRLKEYMALYPDSSAVRRAWSIIRQERFAINRISEGVLITWGTGHHGELGHGADTKHTPFPMVSHKLNNICIQRISAGERHVLAIDTNGRLFSWGCGTSGRLGHGDFEHRPAPEVVRFFTSMIVTHCAAGDAHSAVLTIGRNVPGVQYHKVLTFGRGAHGRLGNGTNKNICLPVLVSQWPDSVADKDIHFQSIACGGAHTLALAYSHLPSGLAFPYGIQTFILAWGYGANGQLGTGGREHSFLPVKVRMPKAEVIVEITAGRSWSLARSFGGTLYSFGKGLRGQLGQGETAFSLSPRIIDNYASYLKVSSQYAHTVGICVQKKHYNARLLEDKYKAHNIQDIFRHHESHLQLAPLRSRALYEVNCCKRNASSHHREQIRYHCLTCKVNYVCYSCSLTCHAGHELVLSRLMNEISKADAKAKPAPRPPAPPASPTAASRRTSMIPAPPGSPSPSRRTSMVPSSPSRRGSMVPSSPAEDAKRARLVRAQSILIKASKNPLDSIFIEADTLQYEDALLHPPAIITATNATTVVAIARLAAKGAALANYLDKGTVLFPRKLTRRLPINVRTYDLKDILHEAKTNERLIYDIKYMERMPALLTNYAILVNNILARIVKKDKGKNAMRKRGSFADRSVSPPKTAKRPAMTLDVKPFADPAPSSTAVSAVPSGGASVSSNSTADNPSFWTNSHVNSITNLVPACHCSLYHKACKLSPNIPEVFEEHTLRPPVKSVNFLKYHYPSKYFLADQAVFKEDQKVITRHQNIFVFYTKFATKIQHLVRRYISKIKFMRLQATIASIRRQVVTEHVNKNILGVVFKKVKRYYSTYREEEERVDMAFEDELMHKYNKYKKLQKNIMAMKGMLLGVKSLLSKASIHYPVLIPSTPSSELALLHTDGTEVMLPSFAFSWISLRAQQLLLHPKDRLPPEHLATLAQYYPIHHKECRYFDLDIYFNYLVPFIQSKHFLYKKLRKYGKVVTEIKRVSDRAEGALRALKLKQKKDKKAGGAMTGAMTGMTGAMAGAMTSKLIPAHMMRSGPVVRIRLNLVNTYTEQLAVFKKVMNHNMNLSLGNILAIYGDEYCTAWHCLDILNHTAYSTLMMSTAMQNTFIEHLINQLNQVYYAYLHALQLAREEEEARIRKEKEAKEAAKRPGSKGGLFAKKPTKPAPKPVPKAVVKEVKDNSIIVNQGSEGSAAHAAVMSTLADKERLMPNVTINTLQRRHSISDPCKVYSRLQAVIPVIHIQCKHRRRASEPVNLKALYVHEYQDNMTSRKSIASSLLLVQLRLDILSDLCVEYERYCQQASDVLITAIFKETASMKLKGAPPVGSFDTSEHVEMATHRSKGNYLWVMYTKTLNYFTPFNPRLPLDIMTLLQEPSRRRTIAEPERLYKQLLMMYQMREKFASIVNQTDAQYAVRRHKRSFDFGEIQDEEEGLMDEMDFGFDDYVCNARVATGEVYNNYDYEEEISEQQRKQDMALFKKDLLHIEQKMIVMRYTAASEEIVQLTKEHLLEKKKINTLKAHTSTKGKGNEDAMAVLEMLSAKLSIQSGSMKAGSMESSKSKKKRKGKKRRGSVGRSSLTGDNSSMASIESNSDDESSGLGFSKSKSKSKGRRASTDYSAEQKGQVEVWQVFYTTEGSEYYYNPENGQTTWTMPEETYYYNASGEVVYLQIESQYTDDQGHLLWYNHSTAQSRYA